jgi:hypothetical protein
MYDHNQPGKSGSTAIAPVTPAEAALLWEPAERKVSQPARLHGITDLEQVGVGRISDVPQVVTGAKNDWVILPAALDPLYTRGKLAAPQEARARVDQLLQAGVHFDYVAIAHEVPAGSYARVKTTAQLEELLAPPLPGSLSVLATISGCVIEGSLRVVHFVTRLRVFFDPLPLLDTHYDPAIFGAIVHAPPARVGAPALFFHLCSWKY